MVKSEFAVADDDDGWDWFAEGRAMGWEEVAVLEAIRYILVE